jgi:glycosyltransferase involved in cell wall biosynthesis
MTASLPAISIITPCLNAASFVAEMVESVRAEPGIAIEHLVMDGGSSDGTLEILARLPHLRVVEEADRGSHDAMNRGLALAGGEIIGFINTDDRYAPRLLAAVAERFAAEPQLDALLGRSYLTARRGKDWRVVAQHPLCRAGGLDLGDLMYGVPCINARFFRRGVFDRIGGFSLQFSFAADRHFLLRLALGGGTSAVLDRPCYFYRRHETSRTLDPDRRNARAIGREHVAIATALIAAGSIGPDARRALGGWLAYEALRAALRGDTEDCTLRLLAALPRGLAGKARALAHRRGTPASEAAPADAEAPPLPRIATQKSK